MTEQLSPLALQALAVVEKAAPSSTPIMPIPTLSAIRGASIS
ncbi:MAG: hypothetical protein ACLSHC_06645 [Bilophila wadsworthia]